MLRAMSDEQTDRERPDREPPDREKTDDFVYLTTTGRVSGRPHEIEIWYHRQHDTLHLMAGAGRRSDWVANLAADPSCSVRLQGVTMAASGRVLDGPTDADEADRARWSVYEKYEPRNPGLDTWRDSALPVAIDLAVAPGDQA